MAAAWLPWSLLRRLSTRPPGAPDADGLSAAWDAEAGRPPFASEDAARGGGGPGGRSAARGWRARTEQQQQGSQDGDRSERARLLDAGAAGAGAASTSGALLRRATHASTTSDEEMGATTPRRPSGQSHAHDSDDDLDGIQYDDDVVFADVAGGAAAVGTFAAASSPATVTRTMSDDSRCCRICLEEISPEELESGEAIFLQCACRGANALRHKACAEKWAAVRRSTKCEVCGEEIKNLPPLDTLPPPDLIEPDRPVRILVGHGATSDLQEDALAFVQCLRTTWMLLIVFVLLLDMDSGDALFLAATCGLLVAMITSTMSSIRRVLNRRDAEAIAIEEADDMPRENVEEGGSNLMMHSPSGTLHAIERRPSMIERTSSWFGFRRSPGRLWIGGP